MEYKLTSKYQHSKHLKNDTRRCILLYFLNNVLIFKQKMPFDENMEYGYNKQHISEDYLLNGRIHQTRSRVYGKNIRNVSYPVSKKILESFNIPIDLKIEKS